MSDTRTVTSVQARRSILKAFKKQRPLFLWGPPGIGKSELVADITEELGGAMIDLRLGQMEPTDIRGIPFYNKDNQVRWTGQNQLTCPQKNMPHNIQSWYCF
jgi:MoxR-like ATPase